MDLSDYTLSTIHQDDGFVLCRGQAVAGRMPYPSSVLALIPSSERPGPDRIRMLEHEFAFRSELESTWAIRPLALGQLQGRTALILEDPSGDPLGRHLEALPVRHALHDQLPAEPAMELGSFLRLAIGIAAALSEVHSRGIVHKNVKPANVFVNAVTYQVWLTGFGIASRLQRERQAPGPPEMIAGTLAYMAPEQTGRMNRSIDARCDLYALGVTLYEMLTGTLPFAAADPMEWVHCHIARQALSPRERIQSVPAPVSAIVMKLLAKTAEERYQTAAGLERDLRRCLGHWEDQGRVDGFALGENDTPDRLLIPEQLYGRAEEIKTLLAAFDRIVRDGGAELVLVSGYSGIGKSTFVNELHKVLVPPRGQFAAGKFDQYKRDIPYSTLAQTLQSLVRALLTEGDVELAHWREALRAALGPNGLLMVDLVPELKLVIGEQSPVPELPPQDAQRRFQLVFRRLLGVFARPEHPLVIFLDDLQWLDAATLDLLEDLLTQTEVRNLLLIGAYRDNEVSSDHPLVRTVQRIRASGALVQNIALGALAQEHVSQLVADSLCCGHERAAPLAALVHERTAGNPFFVIQFLTALVDEEMLTFDHTASRWVWDLARIHARKYTDNVVDLLIGKLSRLPTAAQKALQQLAHIGNRADFTLLEVVYGDSVHDMHGHLQQALQAGLVLAAQDAYFFLHDRVQEAAYSLTPADRRAEAHLKIGMSMASCTPAEKLDEAVFEIVSQLNRGLHLLASVAERERVAELNLIAGRRAKASTAYASALKYLHAGRGLLTDEAWNQSRDLVFSLECLLAECEMLTADATAAETRLSVLAAHAKSGHEAALVTCLRLTLYTVLDRSDRAVEVFLDYWRSCGTDWSPHPAKEDALREYRRIWSLLGERQIEELVDLPLMTDPDALDVLDVLAAAVDPAAYTDVELFALVMCRMVALSLEHGNSDGSCFGYLYFGVLAGHHFGDYQLGFRFGKLGYDLVEQRELRRYQARTQMSFGSNVVFWTRHIKTARDQLRRSFGDANRAGDLAYAAYCCNTLNTNLLAAGDSLSEVQREAEAGLEFATNIHFGFVIDKITAQLGFIRTLRGLTKRFGAFDDEGFDEQRFELHLASEPALALPECWYWIRKLQARFLAGDYQAAIEASLNAQRLLWTSVGFFEVAEYDFYTALSRAASVDSATSDSGRRHVEALATHRRQHAVWAQHCPENFENRKLLVDAEIARIEGRELDAERLYEDAIRSARENCFVHNEAIANETASRFYAARGFTTIADAYLRSARYAYLRWGAEGKVRDLDRRFPNLSPEAASAPTGTITTSVERLDLATVITLSQALSGEMVLEKLLDALMRSAIEHAGAQRAVLILPRGAEQRIAAEAATGNNAIVVHLRDEPVTDARLPLTVLHYVLRSRDAVILDDAAIQSPFSTDPYFDRQRARSVLCLPLTHQAKTIGALYLENTLAPRVFVPARAAVLKLIACQAATSIENARLYRDRKQAEEGLRRAYDSFADAQRLSRTGNFTADLAADEYTWSAELYRIFEIDPATTIRVKMIRDCVHPDDLPAFDTGFAKSLGGANFDLAFRICTPKGAMKHVHAIGHLTELVADRPQFIGAIQDVTERKLAEDALNRARSDLAHVARVTTLSTLTASIAHEVNQPLTGIITNASTCLRMLDTDPPNVETARETARRIIRDGNRAADVIARLRALFSKKEFTPESLDLNEATREVIALTLSDLQENRVIVQPELAEDLPQVTGDRVQLQQVVLNLLRNACDAMVGVNDRPRRLLVRTERHGGDRVRVLVQDTGVGVDRDNLDKLFEPFHSTKSGGMGIGLSISRSIVERHHGRLWAEPNAGPGATFAFSIPCTPQDAAPTGVSSQP